MPSPLRSHRPDGSDDARCIPASPLTNISSIDTIMTTDQTRLIGVIAYPAGPNPEHDLLSRWIDQAGVDASVHLFPFPVKEIADPISALRMLGASGAYLSGRHREAG